MQMRRFTAVLAPLATCWREAHTSWLARLAFILAAGMPIWLIAGRAVADIAVVGIGIAFLLHSLTARQWRWFGDWETKLLLGLYAYIVCQSLIVAPESSALHYALLYARFPLCYLAIRFWLFADERAFKAALVVMLPVALLALLDTYIQYTTHVSLRGTTIPENALRLTGPLTNYNIGNYLFKITMPLLAGLLLYLHTMPERNIRWALVLWGVLLAAAIVLSGERSSTVMLLVALMGAIFLIVIRHRIRWQYAAGVLLVATLGTWFLSQQPLVMRRWTDFFQLIQSFETTVYGQLFKGGWLVIQAHPWLGAGAEQFELVSRPYFDQGLTTYWDVHPHNIYIQWWAETGIVGLTIFLAFLALLFARMVRVYLAIPRTDMRRLASIALAIGAWAGLVFPLLITQSVFSNWPASIYWFSMAMIMTIIDHHRRQAHDHIA